MPEIQLMRGSQNVEWKESWRDEYLNWKKVGAGSEARGYRLLSPDAQRQAERTLNVQGCAWLPLAVADVGEARTACQKILERDTGLEPGQGRTDAEMDAVAEGDVRIGIAADVEAIGLGGYGRTLTVLTIEELPDEEEREEEGELAESWTARFR